MGPAAHSVRQRCRRCPTGLLEIHTQMEAFPLCERKIHNSTSALPLPHGLMLLAKFQWPVNVCSCCGVAQCPPVLALLSVGVFWTRHLPLLPSWSEKDFTVHFAAPQDELSSAQRPSLRAQSAPSTSKEGTSRASTIIQPPYIPARFSLKTGVCRQRLSG